MYVIPVNRMEIEIKDPEKWKSFWVRMRSYIAF